MHQRFFTIFLSVLALTSTLRAQEEVELIEMVIGFIAEPDKDIRSIAFDQIRTKVPGAAATKRFANELPKLSPEAQIGLLSALADRGDAAAKPAVTQMLEAKTPEAVQIAAINALGRLGDASDTSTLILRLASKTKAVSAAARQSLIQLRGDGISTAIINSMDKATVPLQVAMIEIITSRRAMDSIPALLRMSTGRDATIRGAAMQSLGQLAGTQHVPGLVQGVLKATKGNERNAAEKNLMFVCNRIEDKEKRADPLLKAMNKLKSADRTAMIPTLGRVGGPAAFEVVEKAINSRNATTHTAGIRAISNWPDASVATWLINLAKKDKHPDHQRIARMSLLRIAPLPDGRSDAEKLDLLKIGMKLAANENERNYALKRAAAIRLPDTLRFVVPYVDQTKYSREACQTVVELAHDRKLRDDNKTEFHAALDKVIAITKDPVLIDRANRYKQGQTWVRPK